MFMAPDRQARMRVMIMAEDDAGRRAALDQLLPLQQRDFEALFEEMAGLPVTIRLLDPPPHEFLPDASSCTSRSSVPASTTARVWPSSSTSSS
jgi:pyruvate, orthophosphate dikinase